MSTPGILCIAVGAFVVLLRGPMIFAPRRTLRAYRSLVSTDARVRAVGAVLAALGAWIVVSGPRGGDPVSGVLAVLGWLIVFAGGILLLFAGSMRNVVDSVLSIASESVDPAFIRVVGVLAVALGVGLIVLGYRLL